jgi:2-(1,2-epoxy-1,2-dihydrophenyl)acetyl-CoA isomerase
MFIGASLAFDYRILGDNTAIQNPSLELGLAPKGGTPFFLSHTIGRGKVYDLLLSQQDISAQEALQLGVADHMVPMETFEADVIEIAAKFATMPLSSLRLVKRLVNFSLSGLEAYLEYENQQLLQAMHQAKGR